MMKSHNENIRIVVCGDEGVGKSSLITSLVKDTFVPNLQPVLPPITIPRELTSFASSPSSPDNFGHTVIVDTSSLLYERPTLTKEIRRANVIWLVYSDHYTCERISLFWIPFFRSLGVNLPVVVCANKCDLAPQSREDHSRAIADELIPIIQEFKEIESCIRCSAKNHFNVNQTFYLCQRAVTHPLAPLFDSKEGRLKPACESVLQRIFFLADTDQDGYLSDDELLALHRKCFPSSHLDTGDVDQIKSVLREVDEEMFNSDKNNNNSNSNSNNNNNSIQLTTNNTNTTNKHLVSHKGVSPEGFIMLNKIYAEKGRHETTWGILRAFHYTDSLSLESQYLCPKLDVPHGSSVELSPSGYRFLVDLFVIFDKDNDGGLNEAELLALFKPTPELPQLWQQTNFPASTVRNEAGNVTLQGWLAQWSMTTYLDYKTTLTYLALLGFDSRIDSDSPLSHPSTQRTRTSLFSSGHSSPVPVPVPGSTALPNPTSHPARSAGALSSSYSHSTSSQPVHHTAAPISKLKPPPAAKTNNQTKKLPRKLIDAVRVTRPRKRKRLGKASASPASGSASGLATTAASAAMVAKSAITDRNVFSCFVLGSSGSGKSGLLNAFLGRQPSKLYSPTIKPVTVVNSVEMPGGKQCYMILEELGEQEPAILANPEALASCDVVCYTYDSSDPNSFAYLVELRRKYPNLDTLPAVYAALKADLDRQQQRCDVQPDIYTRNLSMAAPLHVSVEWASSLSELFIQLAGAAQYPASATPRDGPEEDMNFLILPAVAATLVASVLVGTYWLRRGPR